MKYLIQNKTQKIAKYPPYISYIHDRIKTGIIIGSMMRIKTQNSTRKLLYKHIARNLFEMATNGKQSTTIHTLRTLPTILSKNSL